MKPHRSSLLGWIWKHEWAIVGCLAATAFMLGLVGLWWHQQKEPTPWSWLDAVYFAIRLFTFELDVGGKALDPYDLEATNWPLHVARFLAPATLALAVVKGVAAAVAGRYNLWRIARWKGHAVVCGAGERGRKLAFALREEGHRVAIIEKNEDCETLADLRAAGCRVVTGGITDPERQARARLDTAGIVAAVTPCVESKLQVVLAASRRDNGLPVRALAYAPRSFAAMLEERRSPRILVVGDGDVVPELVGVLVTQCQYAAAGVPRVDLVTVDPDAIAREVPLHHPQMPQVPIFVRIRSLSRRC